MPQCLRTAHAVSSTATSVFMKASTCRSQQKDSALENHARGWMLPVKAMLFLKSPRRLQQHASVFMRNYAHRRAILNFQF
jgi:hypothetical protein